MSKMVSPLLMSVINQGPPALYAGQIINISPSQTHRGNEQLTTLYLSSCIPYTLQRSGTVTLFLIHFNQFNDRGLVIDIVLQQVIFFCYHTTNRYITKEVQHRWAFFCVTKLKTLVSINEYQNSVYQLSLLIQAFFIRLYARSHHI